MTRWDVNFVLGEFIAELNASHTYRGGGDVEEPARARRRPARRGLGARREAAPTASSTSSAGGPWDADVRSPLAEPGVNVKEGDYVLAVNGVPLDRRRDPWAAFEGLADKPVTLHGQRDARRSRAAARWS